MTPIAAKQLGIILSTVGVLFILASSFGVMRWGYGLFLGVGSFIVAGMVKKLGGIE